jgi:lipopolysaccharide biosynthesis glycosyltransferase
MIPIFIGFDSRESIDYAILSHSLIRHSSSPISITPLKLSNLSFYNETHTDGSTEFSYSRFLVPYLMNYTGWAIYMDSDMLCLTDITELWQLADPKLALMCVQHNYQTKQTTKMWGQTNNNYPKKNWSSLMLINCGHPDVKALTPEMIQNSTGGYLHQFEWLDTNLVGPLPIKWNWLVDEYVTNDSASIIHYTLGSPSTNQHKQTTMSKLWFAEFKLLTNNNEYS